MRRVVIDASVLAAMAFGEPGADRCAAMVEGAALHAPSVLPYELAHAAQRKCRMNPGRSADITMALGLSLDVRRGIAWHDINPTDALLLAAATGLSTYDAGYLWLAAFLGADLVTLDQRLADAHERIG